MLKLLAIASGDGWAYYRDARDNSLHQIRMLGLQTRTVSESEVVEAIKYNGFSEVKKEFASQDELLAYLGEDIVAVRKARGREIPSDEAVFEKICILMMEDAARGNLHAAQMFLAGAQKGVNIGRQGIAPGRVASVIKYSNLIAQEDSFPEDMRDAARNISATINAWPAAEPGPQLG